MVSASVISTSVGAPKPKAVRLLLNRSYCRWMVVPKHHRPPRADVVNVLIPVYIENVGAVRVVKKSGRRRHL